MRGFPPQMPPMIPGDRGRGGIPPVGVGWGSVMPVQPADALRDRSRDRKRGREDEAGGGGGRPGAERGGGRDDEGKRRKERTPERSDRDRDRYGDQSIHCLLCVYVCCLCV
jgi:hypothetical protein